jgi:tetratricopeptide (TPR) repeat protein
VYSVRTPVEATYYMLDAARQKKDAIALGPVWVDAFRFKAYALLELGRGEEAHAALDRALELAPQNAQVLEELGANYQVEKNWPEAMRTFERAEEAAKTFSPEAKRNEEIARAWRGQAFVDVELGKLDEAEQLYRRCLDLDKNDTRATTELEYVRKKRKDSDPSNAMRIHP